MIIQQPAMEGGADKAYKHVGIQNYMDWSRDAGWTRRQAVESSSGGAGGGTKNGIIGL